MTFEQKWHCLYCHTPKPDMDQESMLGVGAAVEIALPPRTMFLSSDKNRFFCRKCGYHGFALVKSTVPWWRRRAARRHLIAEKLAAAIRSNA